jgi:hypothetical protein
MSTVIRSPKAWVLCASALLAPAIFTVAFAQPRGGAKPPAKPPKPPATADAGAASAQEDAGPSAASLAVDAGVAPPIDLPDGATKPSPLNPAPNETPSGAALDAGPPPDYDKLLADIAALRARVAAVGDALYKSRIAISVQTDGDAMKVTRLAVSLDDGVVYTAPPTFSGADAILVYDHAVAPGRHAVTIDVERKDVKDESYRSSQKSRFNVEVPRDHRLELKVLIGDDSTMGADFPGDRSGRYDTRVRVKASAKPVGR